MTPEVLTWSASGIADHAWIERIEALLARALAAAPGLQDDDRTMFELAVSEIAGNMVKHAVYAHCELELIVATKSLTVRMSDEGPDPAGDVSDLDWPDEQAEGGRGLMIARTVLDVFEHERRGGTNHWLLVRRLH